MSEMPTKKTPEVIVKNEPLKVTVTDGIPPAPAIPVPLAVTVTTPIQIAPIKAAVHQGHLDGSGLRVIFQAEKGRAYEVYVREFNVVGNGRSQLIIGRSAKYSEDSTPIFNPPQEKPTVALGERLLLVDGEDISVNCEDREGHGFFRLATSWYLHVLEIR